MAKKNDPKTLKGYISLFNDIEKIIVSDVKGFDNLHEKLQSDLTTMQSEISNWFNDFKEDYESLLNAKSLREVVIVKMQGQRKKKYQRINTSHLGLHQNKKKL